jgi:VCBS repeat-containing protein
MSKTFYKLSGSDFFQDWSNTSQITTSDDWNGVESIVGYRGDGLAASGRDPRLVTADSTVIDVNANATNPNTNTSGGVTEFQIADPVVALQGSGTAQAPSLVLYLDASGRQDLRFSVDLRDIDGSNDNAIQQVTVQYRIGDSGAWINLPGGYVSDASTGPAQASGVTHLDLLLPAAVNNQSQVEIRIMTADAVGSDEWIGVDNIRVTSLAAAADQTPPALASSSPVDGAIGIGQNANLTLNFNELVAAGSGKITISDGAGDVRVIDVTDASQVTVSGQSMVINPTDSLHTGTTYHVTVGAGAVVDLAGNAFGGNAANPIDFTTIADLTRIYEIQGAGHRSPYEGQLVNTRGVVTAIDTSGTKGFWIQDQQGDGNDATSDAVFVFAPNSIGQVKVGDLVNLQGTVTEFSGSNANNLSITEVSNIQELTVLSSGNVIQATVIGEGGRLPPTEVIDSDNFAVFNPDHDGVDFYESLEGMLVTAKNVQVVDDTYQNATYVVTDQGANATGMNDRGGLTHSATDVNPERIEIYTDGGVAPGAELASFETGDLLGDVTGVVSYFGGNYELIPTTTPTVKGQVAISSETTTLDGDTAHLTVGAYNMGNLDPSDTKFDALAYDIVKSMGTPDILGLEEVQDSNGTGTGVLSADVTINKLLDAIVAAGGPRYSWVTVDPSAENANGGEANGNIRNVILYDASRVDYVAGSVRQISDNTPANGDSFVHSRKPLVADFTFHGENVTFVSIHDYSRLGSDEMYGLNQPPEISGDARRNDQTAAVRDYIHQLMLADPDANVVVGGDFNGFHYETSLTQLEANGDLTNLVWKLTATDRYSSTFEGNNEQIDHILVSSSLYATALFDNVHINSNLPYDLGPSDHDAVLSQLLINHAPVASADNAYGIDEDVALAIDAAHGVLANDTDINGDTLSVALVNGPAHGSLELHADGSFEYHASANYNGADSFSYVAKDAFGGLSGVTQVQLTVTAVNDAPVAAAEAATVAEDAAILIDVLANDSDVDSDALSIVLGDVHSALGATLVVENGKVRYVADADSFDQLAAGQSVIDTFTYTADDGHGGRSAPVTVSVKVLEAGDNVTVAGTNKSGVFVDTAGHDTTYNGGNGDDIVSGMDGADTLYGGNGSDVLFGGAGSDFLSGDNGTDILVGGAGFDTISGGNGADVFVVTANAGIDKLLDFRPVIDSIVVGYSGSDSAAEVSAWVKGAHAVDGFAFADIDLDGNGSVDAVGISGGVLGENSVLLNGWTVATLVGQGYLTADHHVRGGWLLAADAPVIF